LLPVDRFARITDRVQRSATNERLRSSIVDGLLEEETLG
jgi:hypothetical protein